MQSWFDLQIGYGGWKRRVQRRIQLLSWSIEKTVWDIGKISFWHVNFELPIDIQVELSRSDQAITEIQSWEFLYLGVSELQQTEKSNGTDSSEVINSHSKLCFIDKG